MSANETTLSPMYTKLKIIGRSAVFNTGSLFTPNNKLYGVPGEATPNMHVSPARQIQIQSKCKSRIGQIANQTTSFISNNLRPRNDIASEL